VTYVRLQIFGDYRIKFKCEALPHKDRLGGVRPLFSERKDGPSHSHDPENTKAAAIARMLFSLTVAVLSSLCVTPSTCTAGSAVCWPAGLLSQHP